MWLGFSLALIDLRSGGCCVDSQSGFWKHLWKGAHSIPVMNLTKKVTFSPGQHAISLTSQKPICLLYTAPCPAWKPLSTLLPSGSCRQVPILTLCSSLSSRQHAPLCPETLMIRKLGIDPLCVPARWAISQLSKYIY